MGMEIRKGGHGGPPLRPEWVRFHLLLANDERTSAIDEQFHPGDVTCLI